MNRPKTINLLFFGNIIYCICIASKKSKKHADIIIFPRIVLEIHI